MEKLIELLNEYEKDFAEKFGCVVGQARTYHYDKEDECIRNQKGEEYNFDSLSNLKDLIKWLVENDKIDYKKLVEDNTWNILKENWWDNKTALLMLLSISDTPIDDLISYLK